MSDAEISTDEASDETNQAVNAWIGYAHSEGLVWDMPNSSETRAFLAGRASVTPLPNVDDLAQIIRYVDGDHKLGAGALAEKIHAVLSLFAAPPTESEEPK